ncbi:hypothetical protein [Streptomyces resistomycificus]|uniref:hypothetical protein n=1 Tax=Streptomyces resistomycificus TaxID=67356 RepID=UPI000A9BBEC0|nr:hypothetical protein [Streptomyces resistomycificus]
MAAAVIMVLFPGDSALSVVARTAVTSLGALVVLIVVRSREKRATGGSSGDVVSLDTRLREGDVPEAPEEREAMRALVEQRLHRTRHRRAALAFLGVMSGGIVVLTALTSGPRASAGLAVFSLAFLAWIFGYGRVQIRRLHRMREALAPREAPAPRAVE